ncbi:ATP-citrate synthase, partial [Thraustotheca clavata]
MSAKAIREYDGKRLLGKWLSDYSSGKHTLESRFVQITPVIFDAKVPNVTFDSIARENPWLLETKLVVKPDQLIKRRGKANLLLLNATWNEVKEWITARMSREIQVEVVTGVLDHFIVEPFVPHAPTDEYYLCIQSNRKGEEILFHHEGGVDVGDVDKKALRLQIPLETVPTEADIVKALLPNVVPERQTIISSFVSSLLALYRDLNFVYMEINPIVVVGDKIVPLDMAAKLDETANFLCGTKWGEIEFPAPFGRAKFPEESFIAELDSKTGASLKLTILNHRGRVWTMVAGGGASVVYADTISDLGFGHELANYGEYSGAPSEAHTYQYARTILDLMTREDDPRGKVLIIGGGIANFTDVAQTFKGIITAITDFQDKLKERNITIWLRRGGPNYQEGLRLMRETGVATGVPIHVFGPETHITAIVPMALGLVAPSEPSAVPPPPPSNAAKTPVQPSPVASPGQPKDAKTAESTTATASSSSSKPVLIQDEGIVRMESHTRCIVYGMQQRAVQGMLDFDFLCKRETPSVAAMIFPFSQNHYLKFYWGTSERLIPVFQDIREAAKKFPDVSVLVNFSSFRSVFSSTMEALECSDTIKTHAIIAEGVPESQTRLIIKRATEKNVGLIGPATVGGIKPGCLRIGNTGGMLDNIVQSKLYRPGSVAYVSKSGGMSNELNNIISQTSDGVFEGVAIGGDKYPGSTFIQHLLRYQQNPEVKM